MTMLPADHPIYFTLETYRAMQHLRGKQEMHTGLKLRNLKERYHVDNLGIDGSVLLKGILKKSVGRARTGLIWLRIWTSGGILCTR
jgi:hypothetical protein